MVSWPEVVVGVPTRQEAPTIAQVVGVVEQGLLEASLAGRAVLVNADNDSPDGTATLFSTAPGGSPRLLLATGSSDQVGKGSNILAILTEAMRLNAGRVMVLDGDLRSAQPWWVGRMFGAVEDDDRPTIAVPVCRRNRYEGNTTNHLASPLLAAVLGVHVQQPIAGDFAFNRAFVERALSWPVPASAHLYGIDVYLTANAAREGHRIVEVFLGWKIHNPGFSKILFMSQQVIDSLFRVLAGAGRPRPARPASSDVSRCTVDEAAVRPGADLVAGTVAKTVRYLDNFDGDLRRLFSGFQGVPRRSWGYEIDEKRWAWLLADGLTGVARGDPLCQA